MVSNKLFITSLLAAAAMSAAPAWAADVTVSGNATADGKGTFTITSTETGDNFSVTASSSSTGLYTYKTTAMNNRYITIGTVSIDADTTLNIYMTKPSDVKFTSATQLTGSGTLILNRNQNGTGSYCIYKIESSANLSSFTGTIEVANIASNAALWLEGSAANARISLSAGAGLVVSGTNVSVAGLEGVATSSLRSQNVANYSGTDFNNHKPDYAGDNSGTDARTLTIGGSGTYSFAGSVGSATGQTLLNLTKSGTGTQTFSGTTYLGNLKISSGELVLSGTSNIAGTTTVTGGELIFSGASTTSKGTASIASTLTTSGSGVVKVLEYGVLDLSSTTVTLGSSIQNSGTVTVSSGTTFNITSLASLKDAEDNYAVISGGTVTDWSTVNASNFSFNGTALSGATFGRYTGFAVGDNGKITFATAAADLVWSDASGDGLWNTSSGNWTNGSTQGDTFVSYDCVEFKTDATVAVDAGGVTADIVTISAGTVSFTGGTITATGGISVTGGTLAVASAAPLGTNVISLSGGTLQAGATLTLANAVNVSAAGGIDTNGNGLTLTGPLSGSGTLTKTGEGALTISGTSADFAGVVNVSAGTLKFGASDVDLLGSRTENVSRIVVGANGVLDLNGQKGLSYKVELAGGKLVNNGSSLTGGNVQFREIVLSADSEVSGSGNFGVVASGTTPTKIDLQGYTLTKKGNNVFLMTTTTITAGTVKIEAGEVRAGNYDGQGGPIDASAADFVLSSNTAILGANNKAFSVKSLSGVSGSKVSLGSGTLKIGEVVADSTVSHTFSGTIADSGKVVKAGAGTLVLDGANTYTGGTTISGGKLVAANTSALGSGLVTVASGAELGLVAGTTVTVANGIDLASGAKIVIDMTGVTAGTGEEVVLTLVSATALNYNETGTFDTAGMLGSVVVLENLSETLSTWTQSLSYSGNTLSLTMTIPEPSLFGLLAGLGALALAGSRRRRRKA